MAKRKIFIVEDEPMIAHDIKEYLEEGDFKVSGIAYNGKSAMNKLKREAVEAVILDIQLKGEISGVDIAHFINAELHIPFIFLTSHADKATLEDATRTRPGGYILKPFDKSSIHAALEVAIFNHRKPDLPGLEQINHKIPTPLSDREYELLLLIKKGLSNSDIASLMEISPNTVKTHLSNLFTKLDAHKRTDALYRVEQLVRGKGPLGR
jgi:DNA-binding NarL/FixJ family response regulator